MSVRAAHSGAALRVYTFAEARGPRAFHSARFLHSPVAERLLRMAVKDGC